MKKEIREVLETTLMEMNQVFTSNEFNNGLKSHDFPVGVKSTRILVLKFLKSKCNGNGYRGKTWEKKRASISIANKLKGNTDMETKQSHIPFGECHCTLEQKIASLKAEGYKIFKTIEI